MLIATSAAEARQRQRRINVHGSEYTLSEYIGAAPKHGTYVPGNEKNDNGLPQGFLVEQPPGSVTPPHFHETNQFQVFVGGSGQMGKSAARPLTVQYANAHTPYGPIAAGNDGVQYFTLRQRWDPGAKYMPASRDLLRKGNQRTRISSAIPTSDSTELATRNQLDVIEVIACEDDGMAAWLYRLPAGAAVTNLPDPAASGGQYFMVTGGTMIFENRTLERLSTLYVTQDEKRPTIAAGAGGLDLLLLQFPRTS